MVAPPPVIRKKFTKAKAVRVSGDHYEMDARVGGNRGAVGARLSDDPMPVAKRQLHQKAMVYDRAVFGTIKLYDKDIEDANRSQDSFINHMDDEMENAVLDFQKHMNIIPTVMGLALWRPLRLAPWRPTRSSEHPALLSESSVRAA